ncbi:MAG: hypothetical protein ACR2J3_04250 [Aridibacter sp.]
MKKPMLFSSMTILLLIVCFGIGANAFGQTKKKQVKQPNQNSTPILKGHFVLKGATCAGFEFTDTDVVNFYADLNCGNPTKLRIYWLEKDTFVLKDIDRINEECPPRVYIYRVRSYVNENLILAEIWTGWGDYK